MGLMLWIEDCVRVYWDILNKNVTQGSCSNREKCLCFGLFIPTYKDYLGNRFQILQTPVGPFWDSITHTQSLALNNQA